jgi:hypothetical protein
MAGRPLKEFDKKTFVDLVGLGCDQQEICWFFRDENGKPANVDTLSRWCKRTFKMNFQEYSAQNKGIAMKIKLRKAGWKLAEINPSVHIFYCKNFLGMTDKQEITQETKLAVSDNFLDALSDSAAEDWESDEDETVEDSSV